MKILSIDTNNRTKMVAITTRDRAYTFPFSKCDPKPSLTNPIVDIWVDDELGNEAFSFTLRDGQEGTIHIDQILEDNRDPGYMTELLLYKLTVEAQKHVKSSSLSQREIIRRLRTSPAQYYRLLDPTNNRKSINKMLNLLQVLGCEVDIIFRDEDKKTDHVLVSV